MESAKIQKTCLELEKEFCALVVGTSKDTYVLHDLISKFIECRTAIRADEAHKCADRAVGFVNENFTLPHGAVVQEFMDKLRLAIMQGKQEGEVK